MQDFGTGWHTRMLDSWDIWLALDDADEDSRRLQPHIPDTQPVTLRELEIYHRQLFYWLLIRRQPCVFPALGLKDGVPAWLAAWN